MYMRVSTYMLLLEPCTTCMKLKGAKRDVSGLCVTSVDIVIRLERPLK